MQPYYDLDGVTIYHGDMFDLLHDLSGVGAVVTDPPYSSGGAFRGDRAQQTSVKYVNSDTKEYRPEFAGDNRDQRAYLAWCSLWMSAARHAAVVGAPIVCFTDWRQLPTTTDALQCAGWIWRNIGTWWKPGIRMQFGRFSSSAEYIAYGTNGLVVPGQGSPQNVISCPPESEKEHIAQKPISVMRWALQVVPPGATVLDPFMGSGTTLHAARDLGHRVIGIDVDERYCEMAAKRLAQGSLFAQQPA